MKKYFEYQEIYVTLKTTAERGTDFLFRFQITIFASFYKKHLLDLTCLRYNKKRVSEYI